MALAVCPECGSSISEYALICPNCGCPNDIILKKKKQIQLPLKCPICNCDVAKHYENNKCGVCGYDFSTTEKELNNILKNNSSTSTSSPPKQSTPHCPVCNSTNIEKISVGNKIKGSMLFGLFSNDAKKQMRCKDCGYKF